MKNVGVVLFLHDFYLISKYVRILFRYCVYQEIVFRNYKNSKFDVGIDALKYLSFNYRIGKYQ